MKQMHIDKSFVVEAELTGHAAILLPTVFKDGNSYCAILGPNPHEGVFGCGCSVEEAVRDWNDHVSAIVEHPHPEDAVSAFALAALKGHNELPE